MDTYVRQNEHDVVDFGHRKRELEFRRDWLHLTRTTDVHALDR